VAFVINAAIIAAIIAVGVAVATLRGCYDSPWLL